ncbi:MAG TPA: methyltransferase domain-containing protein [Candidatus Hydrogenedentes bacterium]|nr:methyltransferase domain-containing protein [Candidatus Hydrogenedentota bacterium]
MQRIPEPEIMDLADEVAAYAGADFSEVNAAFVNRLLDLAGALESPIALDLGSGPGDIPLRLAQARARWRIIGSDYSWPMLAMARAAGGANQISWLGADAKAMPFPESSIDVVFSNSILHHIPDPMPFWREVRRILAPEGWVFLRDLARPDSPEHAAEIVQHYAGHESALLQEEYYRSLLAAFTVDEVQEQIVAAGLAGLRVAMASDRHLDVWGTLVAPK